MEASGEQTAALTTSISCMWWASEPPCVQPRLGQAPLPTLPPTLFSHFIPTLLRAFGSTKTFSSGSFSNALKRQNESGHSTASTIRQGNKDDCSLKKRRKSQGCIFPGTSNAMMCICWSVQKKKKKLYFKG